MLNDTYYIRSLISTVLFLGGLFSLLLYFIYSTGVYGLMAVAAVLTLLLGYFYGWHMRLFKSRVPAQEISGQERQGAGTRVKV